MINLAIFASGNGSNAQNIYDYFKDNTEINISEIYCNNPKAFVIERAKTLNVPSTLFSKSDLNDPKIILHSLLEKKVDCIILAGFLLKIPDFIIQQFEDKIINIHPALLPKYGGKGMYGMNVHKAVKDAKETQTGITIHLVNEHYDEGQILFQAKCSISDHDTPETIAEKVHNLEYLHFAETIHSFIKKLKKNNSY